VSITSPSSGITVTQLQPPSSFHPRLNGYNVRTPPLPCRVWLLTNNIDSSPCF